MVDAVISQPYLDVDSEKAWEGFPRVSPPCPHPLLPAARQDPLCAPSLTDLRADATCGCMQQLFCPACTSGCCLSVISHRARPGEVALPQQHLALLGGALLMKYEPCTSELTEFDWSNSRMSLQDSWSHSTEFKVIAHLSKDHHGVQVRHLH